jgi:predicted methyltransferase
MIRFLSLAAVLLAPPALALELLGPPGAPASAFPDPDRPVAEIIAPLWASEAERDAADEVGQVIRLMEIRAGQTVADIGAGSGYYTVRLAEHVGPQGRVLAEDVTPLYLAGLERRLRKAKLDQVTLVRGEAHDPRLPPGSVDAAVLVHMYHEITQPFGLLYNLAAAMKPGGRVGIVDADAIPSRHGTPLPLLRCELSVMGYREIAVTVLHGGSGYLAVFEPPAVAARPQPAQVRSCPDTVTRTDPKKQ